MIGCKKPCILGVQPGYTKSSLLNYNLLQYQNLACRSFCYYTFQSANDIGTGVPRCTIGIVPIMQLHMCIIKIVTLKGGHLMSYE